MLVLRFFGGADFVGFELPPVIASAVINEVSATGYALTDTPCIAALAAIVHAHGCTIRTGCKGAPEGGGMSSAAMPMIRSVMPSIR